jgi:hypothetical protein
MDADAARQCPHQPHLSFLPFFPSFLFPLSSRPAQDPMDLGTMEERLASRRYYITLNMFAADFYKMVKNCQVGAAGGRVCGVAEGVLSGLR